MDSNNTVQFKPVYSHSHINLYNSPVISAAVPNLTIASGLNLVNNTINGGTSTNHESNHLNALATIHAASSDPSLSMHNAAQLVPTTALSNIQLQQMHQHNYVEQTNNRNNNQQANKSGNQFLQVHLTTPLPAMAQASLVRVSQNQAQLQNSGSSISGNSADKTTSEADLKDGTQMKQEASRQSTSSQRKPQSVVKSGTLGDNLINDLSNKYVIINNGKGFRCLICGREFTQKGNLKTHAMTHLRPSERPYDCETCGKRFTQKGNRDIHVKIHTGTKDHTCPYCDRGFTQRGNLKTHIRSVHTGEKPFSCGHCGKTFSQKANMLTHFRTHDKNSRFSCNTCGKTFSQKGNLKTHQQRHGLGS